MSIKGDFLLKEVVEIVEHSDVANDELNIIKPEILKYLKRDKLKEKIRNWVIGILTVLVFVVLVVGGKL